MALGTVIEQIAKITCETSSSSIAELSLLCETCTENAAEILEAVEKKLATSSGKDKLKVWLFIDRLAKQSVVFLEALKPKISSLAIRHHPETSSTSYKEFLMLLDHSFVLLFGAPLVSLIALQLQEGEEPAASLSSDAEGSVREGNSSSRSLVTQRDVLQTIGGFSFKPVGGPREGNMGVEKSGLQVKTVDSQMAMNVASSYTPAVPVDIAVPFMQPDADAPQGFMKAVPSDHVKTYQEARRKRLREVMEKAKEEHSSRQEESLLERVRKERRVENERNEDGSGSSTDFPGSPSHWEDIQMPLEFPRDEFGVKIGNYPLGVRYLRDAIQGCGGAVELTVLSNRVASLANREAVTNFGNLREFLRINSPTFRLSLEKDQWIVRLTSAQDREDEPTWEAMTCPHCSKVLKGRNFGRHRHCRSCITAQIALGLQGDYHERGPIAELAYCAKQILSQRDSFDDGDIDAFGESLKKAAEVRRFRLASTRQFSPIMKAINVIRDRWLARKGASTFNEAVVSCDDFSAANFFGILGRSIHRLPIPWIEMGDIVDMCRRFSTHVLPPFNPPPRPADPRISLQNEYPEFLLCESELDDEDDPSGDEEQFSDEDAPTFTFAPPVTVTESIFTAGFPRDTKRLQHRMRTAPPLLLSRVIKSDGNQTQQDLHAERNGLANIVV